MCCNTVQPLQHIVTHCNTLCNTQTHRNTLCNTATLQYHTVPPCTKLQHTATHSFLTNPESPRNRWQKCANFCIIRALFNSTIFPQHCLSAALFLQSIYTISPYNLSWYFCAALFFCSTVFTICNGICLLRYFCNL